MMAPRMTLEKAQEIATVVRHGVAKHGAQFSAPYRPYEITEALGVLVEALDASNQAVLADARAQVAAANRRAGAAESRLKRCMNKQEAERDPEQPSE